MAGSVGDRFEYNAVLGCDNDLFCRAYADENLLSFSKEAVDIFAIIARTIWFGRLPGEAQQRLAQAARVKHYKKGSYLYTTGQHTTDVLCVVTGRVRLGISSALGQEFAITDLTAESWTGEQVLMDDEARVFDAQVVEDATVLVIPRSTVLAVGDDYPEMYRELFAEHIRRTRRLYELLGGMLFYPLRSRLAGRLLELVNEHGEEVDGGVYVSTKLSQNDFARFSLGSRQRINKIFREWCDRDIIVVESDKYFIKDLAALRGELELTDLRPE